jgi:polar amino acid transport system substrate-binding protein
MVAQEKADIGFFAIDPLRGADIAFTAPYVLIEGCYLVREGSPLRANDEVDREGHTVVVGKGSAYDLYLTRQLNSARIERSPTSPTVVDTFMALGDQADVAAGVKQQLEADAARLGGLRLLPGRFMVIRQAMGVPKSRGRRTGRLCRREEGQRLRGRGTGAPRHPGRSGSASRRRGLIRFAPVWAVKDTAWPGDPTAPAELTWALILAAYRRIPRSTSLT